MRYISSACRNRSLRLAPPPPHTNSSQDQDRPPHRRTTSNIMVACLLHRCRTTPPAVINTSLFAVISETALVIHHALVDLSLFSLLLFSSQLLNASLTHQPPFASLVTVPSLGPLAASPKVAATRSSSGDVEDLRPLTQLGEATRSASLLSLDRNTKRHGRQKTSKKTDAAHATHSFFAGIECKEQTKLGNLSFGVGFFFWRKDQPGAPSNLALHKTLQS